MGAVNRHKRVYAFGKACAAVTAVLFFLGVQICASRGQWAEAAMSLALYLLSVIGLVGTCLAQKIDCRCDRLEELMAKR